MWFEVGKRFLRFVRSREYASGWRRFIRIFFKFDKFFMHGVDANDAGYDDGLMDVLEGIDVSISSLEIGAKEFILNLEEVCKEDLGLPH